MESIQNQEYIVVVDVDTNGLCDSYIEVNHSNLRLIPNIVRFSWGLYTLSGDRKEIKDYIIRPNGWLLHGTERYHGITMERATDEGVNINEVLSNYKNDINGCVKIVGHSVENILKIIKAELLRCNIEINDVDYFCTMKEGTEYCKLLPKKNDKYKWPKLSELYQKCFNDEMSDSGNSYYDVIHCAQCYFELIK